MDLLSPLVGALNLMLVPTIVFVLVVGVLWGAVAGAMPGFNTTLAIGVVVPFTFALGPTEAVAFLVAIAIGVAYGNSIPAILMGIPGNASAVLTAIDGNALHKRGLSGLALGAAYFSAVVGQFLSTIFFVLMVVPLAQLTYYFLAPELFALTFMGMTALVSLTGKNVLKGILAACIGLMVSVVGPDPIVNVPRFAFGVGELRGGIQIIPVTLGLLAVSEILRSARQIHNWDALVPGFSAKFPGRPELRRMVRPVVLGTTLGSFIGAIPGMSGVAAAAVSYQQAKILSKHPEEFGNGSLEGIAANEAAQNASTAGEMVPTLGLGIPGSDSMVLLLTALTIHGLLPGPLLVRETPDMLYAAVAGLLGGTLVLALVGWQISRMLLRAVSLDRRLVLAVALGLVIIGVFSLRQSVFDLLVLLVFSLIGYFMLRYGYSTAAAAIAVILGGLAEGYLRQGLNLVKNDWGAFLGRPITATILVIAFAILGYGIWMTVREIRSASVPGPEAGADPT